MPGSVSGLPVGSVLAFASVEEFAVCLTAVVPFLGFPAAFFVAFLPGFPLAFLPSAFPFFPPSYRLHYVSNWLI